MPVADKFPPGWEGKPPEKIWSAACRSYGLIWGLIGKAVFDDLGEAGVAAIGKGMKKVAEKQATKAFESGRYPRNAKGMAEYMMLAEGTLGMLVEAPQVTEQRSVFRILKCPLHDDPKAETTPEVCSANSMFEKTAARIANPKLSCTQTRVMSKGDPYCEWVFELEG
jgi:predicted hydrocarbon binding protein